jgi:hypothetical protein
MAGCSAPWRLQALQPGAAPCQRALRDIGKRHRLLQPGGQGKAVVAKHIALVLGSVLYLWIGKRGPSRKVLASDLRSAAR